MDPALLENALEKKCKNHVWLAWILFLTASPIILNSSHLTSYAFLGGNPSFFCDIPELVDANWTNEQIREVSSPGLKTQSCVNYAWNYTLLKDLSFDEALSYINEKQKPEMIKCKNYIYIEDVVHQTVISEWDLVCDNSSLSSIAGGAVAIGKLCGAVTFGFFSDRFGRKKIFLVAFLLYAASGTSAAFVRSPTLFIILRIFIGISSAGVFNGGFTILLELTVKNYRACVGNLYNLGYSFGMIYLSLAAYFTNNWRQLQLSISVPIFLVVIHCWFLPESPRWLITTGNFKKALKIIGKDYGLDFKDIAPCPPESIKNQPQSVLNKVVIVWKKFIEFFSTLELTKRLLICSYIWFQGCLHYYVVALNGLNIDVNQYLYVGLNGITEIPGVISPILLVKYFGRKTTGISLWSVAGITLLVTIVIPKGWPVMCLSLFGRLVGAGATAITMLYTSELFPTEHRNFAIGCSATVAQFGPLLAPYIVDVLGKMAWWLPTTVCGLLALIASLLMIFLPETRDTPMPDTINKMNLS